MRLLIGLGNPEPKHKLNRHNAGHIFVDYCLDNNFLSGLKNLVIKKSDTYMNFSGEYVAKLLRKYHISLDNLYIIHDDLDLKLGEFKIQKGVGPKLHNGIESVSKSVGSEDYFRVRLGVDARVEDKRTRGEEYVLQDFSKEEYDLLSKTIKNALEKLKENFKNEK